MARDTSNTDYHGLERPTVGDDWVAAWDDLVEELDQNLKMSGYKGDRPNASDIPVGAWYEATDENTLYRNDATNGWVSVLSNNTSVFEDTDSDGILEQQTGDGIFTPEINNEKTVLPSEDLQTAINNASDSAGDDGSYLRLLPYDQSTGSPTYNLTSPIRIENGVNLDIRGAHITTDAIDHAFEIGSGAKVLGHGATIECGNLQTACWYLNGDNQTSNSNNPSSVFGYPECKNGSDFAVVRFEQTTGNSVAMFGGEFGVQESGRLVEFNSADGAGYLNDNILKFRGSVNATGDVVHFQQGPGNANFNYLFFEHVQIKGADRVAYINNGAANVGFGWFGDMGNATTAALEWGSGAGNNNLMRVGYGGSGSDVGADKASGNVRLPPQQFHPPIESPQDVSGSRSTNTWYQNTSDAPIRVVARLSFSEDLGSTNTEAVRDVTIHTHNNSSQSTNYTQTEQHSDLTYNSNGSTTINYKTTVTMIVPDGNYYKIDVSTGFAGSSINSWHEHQIGF